MSLAVGYRIALSVKNSIAILGRCIGSSARNSKILNKHTHLRPDVVITDPAEVDEYATEGLQALCDIFDMAQDSLPEKGRFSLTRYLGC
jgi:hypothetical protein